jgi:divalent metal cation (Fe/Co/Zn/Cd) transporter
MPIPKKRKRNRQRYKSNSGTHEPNKADIEGSETLSALKLQLVSLTVVILIAIGTSFIRAKSREEIFLRVPPPVIIIFIFAMLLLIAKATWITMEYYFGERTHQQLKRLFLWDFISGVFIFSAVLLELSYLYGIPGKIAILFRSLIPTMGEKINISLSTIISWTLSGIIGNFAYAMLTKLVSRLMKGESKESLKHVRSSK